MIDWITWSQFTLTGLGVLFTTLFGYATIQFAKGYREQGKKQASLDGENEKINANTLLEQDVKALSKKVNEQSVEMKRMGEEITKLRTAIEERDKILQGRNPQMEAFLTLMTEYVKKNEPILKVVETETIPTIRDLKEFLHKQTY